MINGIIVRPDSLKISNIKPFNIPLLSEDMVLDDSLTTVEKYQAIEDIFGAYEQTAIVYQHPGFVKQNDSVLYFFGSAAIDSLFELIQGNLYYTLTSPMFIVPNEIFDNGMFIDYDINKITTLMDNGVRYIDLKDVEHVLIYTTEVIDFNSYDPNQYAVIYDTVPYIKYKLSDDLLYSSGLQNVLLTENIGATYKLKLMLSETNDIKLILYNDSGDSLNINDLKITFIKRKRKVNLYDVSCDTLFNDPYFSITDYVIGYDSLGNVKLNGDDYIVGTPIELVSNTKYNHVVDIPYGSPEYNYIMDNISQYDMQVIVNGAELQYDDIIVNPIINRLKNLKDNEVTANTIFNTSARYEVVTDKIKSIEEHQAELSEGIVLDHFVFFESTFSFEDMVSSYNNDDNYISKYNVLYDKSDDSKSIYYKVNPNTGEILNNMVYVDFVLLYVGQ